MNALIKKVSALLPDLEMRGTVYLFALGEREDINQWDVILSAEWSDENYTSAVRFVADELVARLESTELTALAGVIVIPSSEPNIRDLPESLENLSPEEEKVLDLTLLGLEIRSAYVFKAQRPAYTPATASTSTAQTV